MSYNSSNFSATIISPDENVVIVIYYVIMPCLTVFGIILSWLSLRSFWKKAKTEVGLWYQIIIIGSSTLCLINCTLIYIISYYLKVVQNLAPMIIRQNYFINNLIVRGILPLCTTLVTAIPFFNLVMSVDRIYAIFFPMKYRTNQKKRNIIISFIIILVISLSTSLYEVFRFNVSLSSDKEFYTIVEDVFVKQVGKLLVPIRSAIHIFVVIIIVVLNMVVAWQIMKYKRKKRLMFRRVSQENSTRNQQVDEYTLTVMQLVQGTLFFIGQVPQEFSTGLSFVYPSSSGQRWRQNFTHFAHVMQALQLALAGSTYLFTTKRKKFIMSQEDASHSVKNSTPLSTIVKQS